jgi:hypothetical protein
MSRDIPRSACPLCGETTDLPLRSQHSYRAVFGYWLNFFKTRSAKLADGGSGKSDEFTVDDSLPTAYALKGGGALHVCVTVSGTPT